MRSAAIAEAKNSKTILQSVCACLLLLVMGSGPSYAQLTLNVRVSSDPVQASELLRYELTVTDAGASTVNGVTLRLQTSASITILSTDAGACTPDSRCLAGSLVTWSLGTLSPGQSVKRELVSRVGASVTTGTQIFGSAQVTASNASQVDVSRSVSVDLTRTLAVAIVEAAEPAVPGEPLTYVVNFANSGNTADAGVMLRAEVPAGTEFLSATQGGTEDAGVVTWSLGTVGVGQSGERRFTVEVTDPVSSVLSFAELSDALNPGLVRAHAETAALVLAAPPLALDVTLTPDPVQSGELIRVNLTVRNRSQITVTAASLQDQTLDGTAIVAVDGGSCTPDSRCLANSVVTWSLGTLSPGQSVQRQLLLRAAAGLPAATLLFNSAHVTASNASEAHCDRSVPVDPARALEVAIAVASEPAVPDELLTYIVNFANQGNTADVGVTLQALVPAGTQFVSATQGGGEDDGIVSWSLGTVSVGGSGERRFTVKVTDAALETLFGAAELSDQQNPGVVRVRAEVATPVQVEPPLAIDMTITPEPVQPGELLRVDLSVRNRSQITLTGVSLQNQTLDGTAIVAVDGGSCTPDSRCLANSVVTWSLGTLSPGDGVKRQLIVRAGATLPAATLLFNTAHVTASNAPEVHADRFVPIGLPGPLSVTIAEATEPAVPGELLTYIINFTNRGSTAATGVLLQAPVPTGTQFVSATQGGSAQAGLVSWSLGTVGVGQGGERRFTVQVLDTAEESVFGAAELSDALNPGVIRARAEVAAPVQAAPPLVLDMTLTPDPVLPNELVRIELTVRNRSQITVSAASLRNQTLDGTAIVSTDGGTCTPDSRCLANSLVTWSLGTLSPGQSVVRQLIVRAGATLPAGTLLYNPANVTANNAREVHADRSVPVDTARALTVSIAEQTEPAVAGGLVTYIVSFANRGNTAVTGAMLKAAVPPGTQFVSSAPGGAEHDGVISWALGTVGVGQSAERSFVAEVQPDAPGVVFSSAELSDAGNPDVVRVRAESVAPVIDVAPLVLDVAVTPNPVAPNGTVHYALTVQNTSQITVTGATLQDLTLDGTSIVSANGGTCTPDSRCLDASVVTWSLGDLAPGQSTMRLLDLRIQPTVSGGVLVFNSARASATNAAGVRVDRSMRVCTVAVCEPVPPTPTPTVTPTSTPTATPTHTGTATPTSTNTATATITATPTHTPTHSPTASPTATPSVTDTPTVTSTPTVTATATETPTATDTATPTVTSTATDTPTPTVTVTPTPTLSTCIGDCNANGDVEPDELLVMMNIALGHLDVLACKARDANNDGNITVDEILTAVNNAVDDCAGMTAITFAKARR